MQSRFGYSDLAMGERRCTKQPSCPHFAGGEYIPDETMILNFNRLLDRHELAAGIVAVVSGYLGSAAYFCTMAS